MAKNNQKRTDIAQRLLSDIYEKELDAGDRVGSVRRLAMRYHSTPLTISRMLSELVDEGVLYRDARHYFCVKTPPLKKPHLAYAGFVFAPNNNYDCLLSSATGKLLNKLSWLNAAPDIIGYYDLLNYQSLSKRLASVNGLLLDGSFADHDTGNIIRQFSMPIVRIGWEAEDSGIECSSIVQNLIPALREFIRYCDLASYKRVIIIKTDENTNSELTEKTVKDFLLQSGCVRQIESLCLTALNNDSADISAFCHFINQAKQTWKDVLFISCSGYFSRGICRALYKTGEIMPDILSIDNLDDYEKCPVFKEPYLTAIDRNMDQIYCDAAQLLYDIVRNNDKRLFYIQVPARLVIRKSITHIRKDWKGY